MEKLDKRIYSLLDANFGRLLEGARVLEDIARFVLRDEKITKSLKKMRHFFSQQSRPFNLKFLDSRSKDLGERIILKDEKERNDISDLVLANSKRCQEALRVLEEYFKFLKKKNWIYFQKYRFFLYQLEKEIFSRLIKKEKLKKIFPLYLIFDAKYFKNKAKEILKEAILGGVKCVQYRDKINSKQKILKNALILKKICQKYNVLFLINDHLDVALAVKADGVHLGQKDFPLKFAKKILPFDKIVGISVHNLTQAKKAKSEGADYISVGALFPSETKKDAKLINLSEIEKIKEKVSLPLIAVGGIKKEKIKQIMKIKIDGVAVCQAIMESKNPKKMTKELLREIQKYVT